MLLNKIVKAIKNPKRTLNFVLGMRIARIIPDKTFLKMKYRLVFGKKLNLDDPKTFTEKLQWQKLYDRKPEYTQLADKYKVRNYIKDTIGEKYLIPLLGVYNSYQEIDFEILPEQFVLKPNHTSGDVFICKDKSKVNYKQLEELIKKWMKRRYYWYAREWPYKNIVPCIICEKFMSETESPPDDYKIMCFNGKAKLVQVRSDRFTYQTQDLYDLEWNKIDFIWGFEMFERPGSIREKPKQFEEIIMLSERLAANMCQVRIDWYIVQDDIYFGEITFLDGAGFIPFEPESYDYLLGSWITLPQKRLPMNASGGQDASKKNC